MSKITIDRGKIILYNYSNGFMIIIDSFGKSVSYGDVNTGAYPDQNNTLSKGLKP